MTLQSQKMWRRAVTAGIASTGIAVAMAFGSATAHADVLDDLAQEYKVGAGGGQLSNLLDASLKLRAMGFKPRPADLVNIQDSLKYKPNQTPLINALKGAIAYQQKVQAQMTPQTGGGGWTVGINQYDPSNPGALGGFGVTGPGGYTIGTSGG